MAALSWLGTQMDKISNLLLSTLPVEVNRAMEVWVPLFPSNGALATQDFCPDTWISAPSWLSHLSQAPAPIKGTLPLYLDFSPFVSPCQEP